MATRRKIFVNYRRGDDPGFARALYQQLESELPDADLFMDVEGRIKPGDDFAAVLTGQVAACDVLLAVIGPRWVELLAARAGDPEDFVTIEIKAALDQRKRVIPVLVGGAGMPRADALPEPIRALTRFNAVSLRPDRFSTDCRGLVTALKQHLAPPQEAPAARNQPERAAAGAERPRRAPEEAERTVPSGKTRRESRKGETLADLVARTPRPTAFQTHWRRIRIVAWAAVAGLLIAAGAAYMLRPIISSLPGSMPLAAGIGGPFELTTHEGKRLSSAELKGTPFALFFGFTHCPDVCPTTMLELSNAIKALGPDADRMRFFFVSVDPERDTPEQLKLYLSNFDPRIAGLVGTPAEIAAVAKAYRAIYQKVPTKDGFTYNHTALVYLMGPDGRLAGTITYQENADAQLKKLRRLIGVS